MTARLDALNALGGAPDGDARVRRLVFRLRLTATRAALLVHLLDHPDWMHSPRALRAALGCADGSANSIKVHICEIRRALRLAQLPQPIENVSRLGYGVARADARRLALLLFEDQEQAP